MQMAPKQSRAFCFTLNNPARYDIPADWFKVKDVVYVVWQVEQGANGTEHLQGYCITKANDKSKAGYSIKWCKENLNGKAHWEIRMGTHKQAEDYCKKKETRRPDLTGSGANPYGPWTLGEWKDQETTRAEVGERAKKVSLLDVKDSIDKGATDKMLWDKHFSAMTRYSNAFKQYQLLNIIGERQQPYVMCFWGEPGCGKSERAQKIADANGGAYWYSSHSMNSWWDGYNPAQHKVVVLDDFKGGVPYTMFLRMLDKYPLQVEVKGSTLAFNPAVIIITSNTPPNQWYFQDNVNFDHSAILRRLAAPFGMTVEMKKTPGFAGPQLDMAPLELVLKDIEDGTFYDILQQEVGPPPTVVDLTDEDFVEDDEEAIARAEQASLAMGDYETDSYEFVDDVDLGEGAQPGGAVSVTADLDRDFAAPDPEASPKFISARRMLRRTDAPSLAFNTPLNRAGSFKKLGNEKVQAELTWVKPADQKRRKIMVPMKDNNDDDGDE